MKVPLLDLWPQHQALRHELLAAVERVIDSQQFVLGPDVHLLEQEIARYSGTRFAIGCASGSDALLLALMALDVKAGDRILFGKYSGSEVKIEDKEYLILREEDVLAILE